MYSNVSPQLYQIHQPSSGMIQSHTDQHLKSERVVSSAILGEHFINGTPEDTIKYVEVPIIEEVIRHVPRKEIVEVEKRVPRYEYEWVEKIVEVPQIQTINKHVEVPQIQEVVKHIPVKQIVDVVKEVVRYVPRIETKIIEQEVEVPGEIIEIPKPYLVENKVVVPRYIDREVPTIVAQRLQPIISESEEHFTDVELKQYDPYLVPVDVYIPRAVHRNLIATTKTEEHRIVDVPPAQYNALVKSLNTYIQDKDAEGLFVKLTDGSIPVLQGLGAQIVAPLVDSWLGSHTQGQQHVTFGSHNAGNTASSSTTFHQETVSRTGNSVLHSGLLTSTPSQVVGGQMLGGQLIGGQVVGGQLLSGTPNAYQSSASYSYTSRPSTTYYQSAGPYTSGSHVVSNGTPVFPRMNVGA